MIEHCVYFPTDELKELIRKEGGQWNDSKQRPLVCVVKSTQHDGIYWAIPMGDMSHRTEEQAARIQSFLDRPTRDIASCYYHIANTDKKSLFFISDAIPITDEFIERSYQVSGNDYVIKNKATIAELKRKLSRILAVERRNPNHFRQHITDIEQALLKRLGNSK